MIFAVNNFTFPIYTTKTYKLHINNVFTINNKYYTPKYIQHNYNALILLTDKLRKDLIDTFDKQIR